MLRPEPTKLLVAALRSGEFTQAEGCLQDDDGNNCCLGVACRVAIRAGLAVEAENSPEDGVLFDGADAFLPDSVANWLTTTGDHDPEIDGAVATLRNDAWGDDFATAFEAQLRMEGTPC